MKNVRLFYKLKISHRHDCFRRHLYLVQKVRLIFRRSRLNLKCQHILHFIHLVLCAKYFQDVGDHGSPQFPAFCYLAIFYPIPPSIHTS